MSVGGSSVTVSGAPLAGAFYLNSFLGTEKFADGLSKTAFVSEVIRVPGADQRGVLHYPEGCLYQHNTTPNSSMPDGIRSGSCVSVAKAPCSGTFTAHNNRKLDVAARSEHPGGVQLLLGDGAVSFVPNSVDLNIWKALSTPSAIAGEVAGGGL